MDPQFEELSERITKDVTAAVTQNVTAAVTAALGEHVTKVVTAAEMRLSRQAQVNADAVKEQGRLAEQRLSHQAQVNAEAVKEQASLAAEGYAATLDAINRRLDRIENEVTSKLRDHDDILSNHGQRLIALERERS